MGGFFAAWTKSGRGELEGGYYLFPLGAIPNEPATSGLTKTTFSWKSRYGTECRLSISREKILIFCARREGLWIIASIV